MGPRIWKTDMEWFQRASIQEALAATDGQIWNCLNVCITVCHVSDIHKALGHWNLSFHQTQSLALAVPCGTQYGQHPTQRKTLWDHQAEGQLKTLWRGMEVVSRSCKASTWPCYQGGDCILAVCSCQLPAPITNNNHQGLLSSLAN